MKYTVTQRPDWSNAINETYRFFNEKDYAGEKLEERILFYCQMMEDFGLLKNGKRIVDLGAGIYWFNPLTKLLGAEVHLVDDFSGGGGVDNADRSYSTEILKKYREEWKFPIHEQDILSTPLPFEDSSVDAITCFHCLEHWHRSPKHLFAEIYRVLKPGGLLFLATPNAVNIRKRISVPLGYNNWAPLDEWYEEEPVFRGHVREPILSDLKNMCERNNLEVIANYGRNFIGRDSQFLHWIPRSLRHGIAACAQVVLQFFPTLCSDLHVVGRKR
ncbi:MAG: class I SAM-dependent methyltransferase [Akkermansiaceae bacterium]|jgi:SAM-dependent methyltransferase